LSSLKKDEKKGKSASKPSEANRMLKVKVTDGKKEYFAIESDKIKCLDKIACMNK
jgi:hypothetical protein